jgi:DNA primase
VTRYTADSRDRVFDAVDMLALVSDRTELRRRGVDSYFGLCPFHDERTPSFHVRPDEKHYFCFGCQESGDPFSFVMTTQGLDFKGALESLADRFGVTLETEDEDPEAASRRERRERLYSLLGRAAIYYARYLWEAREAAPAREYLLGRGLEEETLHAFRVGYAPSAWDRLLKASRTAGFSQEELVAAGLMQRSRSNPGQVYDPFRGRIVFPSLDSRGRVRGFGGRAMRDNQLPKYRNTADNEIYHKRSQLFGLDLARASAARAGRMILVEGYTDVLALHQAGMRNVVGIMGTALTEEQVRKLERIVSVLELCLDADRAGHDAMLRAERFAAGRKLELRVVPLPEGTDPAEMLARDGGVEELRARVEASVPFVGFHVDRILDRADTTSAEGRDRALQELRPVMAELHASVLREELLRKVAGRLELSAGMLASLVAAAANIPSGPWPSSTMSPTPDATPSHLGVPAAPLDRSIRNERAFLALCIALPDDGASVLAQIDPDTLLTSSVLRRAAGHLTGRTDSPLSELPPEDEELARTMAELVEQAGRGTDVTVERLEHAHLVLERARLDRAIVRARAGGGGSVSDLAREREHVLEAIHGVVARLEKAV